MALFACPQKSPKLWAGRCGGSDVARQPDGSRLLVALWLWMVAARPDGSRFPDLSKIYLVKALVMSPISAP
jgi:hypothetical protein